MTLLQPKLTELYLHEIIADESTQVRRFVDDRDVEQYAEAILNGETLPPVTVFYDMSLDEHFMADGHIRYQAHEDVGLDAIQAEVYNGTKDDALEFALSSNSSHGVRRTSADKRNCIEIALQNPKWGEWSNSEIARLTKTSDKTVAKVRDKLTKDGKIPERDQIKTRRQGKTHTRKKQTNRPKKKPGSSIQVGNHNDLIEAINLIQSLPFDGQEAVERYDLQGLHDDFRYCREWFGEAERASNV